MAPSQDGGKPLNDVIVLRDRSVADRAKQEALELCYHMFVSENVVFIPLQYLYGKL